MSSSLSKWLALAFVWCCAVRTYAQPRVQPTADTSTAAMRGMQLFKTGLTQQGSVLAPIRYGDRIYFTLSVPGKLAGRPVMKIYSSLPGRMAEPALFNPKDEENHAAHTAFNPTGSRVYHTLIKESTALRESEICYRDRSYEGRWENLVKPLAPLNLKDCVTAQPACGYDPVSKKELLFFSSNRPGGKGGFDIWACTVERDGTFGNPVNLPFNTPANEMTPYFSGLGRRLYYSSNGRGTLGGFDVWTVGLRQNGTWDTPIHLGPEINSPFDELYFSYHQQSGTAYLTSNRPNENCGNAPGGCADYSIFYAHFGGYLNLTIRSALGGAELYGCNVELEDATTRAIETTLLNLEEAHVQLPIAEGKKYRLIVSRPGYFPKTISLENLTNDFSRSIDQEVVLQPMR